MSSMNIITSDRDSRLMIDYWIIKVATAFKFYCSSFAQFLILLRREQKVLHVDQHPEASDDP